MYVDYVNDRGSKSSLCETDPYCIFYTLLCMRAGKYTLRAPPQAHTAERRRGHDRQIETPREPPGHHLGVQARLLTTLRWGISRRGPFDIFLTTAPP
jgi:hypothetical protein